MQLPSSKPMVLHRIQVEMAAYQGSSREVWNVYDTSESVT